MADTQQTEQGASGTTEVSILDEIMAETEARSDEESKVALRSGLSNFVSELIRSTGVSNKEPAVNREAVDSVIEELDRKIGIQMDEILHDPQFQALESAWRSLKYLVDETDYRQGIRTEFLSVSKQDLLEDFRDAPEIPQSGLYQHIYSNAIGVFGGAPYGAMVANYSFDTSSKDIELLRNVSSVASMAHCPFIAAAAPQLFGKEDFQELSKIKELEIEFEDPKYAAWNSFRKEENSKYIGLTMPRFLLREPYSKKTGHVRNFNYSEFAEADTSDYCWGNAAFALAARLSDSFGKYGWCPNIIGPQSGGAVRDLPVYHYDRGGNDEPIVPTEILITDRREHELSEQGFIPLAMRKDSDNAAFFGANSVMKPETFPDTPEGKAAETNFRLSTRLPYMFIITRLSHFLKVMQRENIGSWKTKMDLNRELNNWIRQYQTDMENPSAEVRSRKPLRNSEIVVEDFPGRPGWFTVSMSVVPHFKYEGADFTLSLRGKLDAESK